MRPAEIVQAMAGWRLTLGTVSVAVFAGIVLGAVGGGFAWAALIICATLITAGVWRAVGLLAVIAGALVDLPHTAPGEAHETVRIPR